MKSKLFPLLVALALTGGAGVASAATSAPRESWSEVAVQWVECAFGNTNACMELNSEPRAVTQGDPGDPSIKNR